ncbi:MAG: hypothetical protein ACETVW_01110 [Dehalococcoidia bacterium]
MRKTTIELSDEQYFYLKEKVLALQKQNHSISMVSLIRQLIDQDIKRSREGISKDVEKEERKKSTEAYTQK